MNCDASSVLREAFRETEAALNNEYEVSCSPVTCTGNAWWLVKSLILLLFTWPCSKTLVVRGCNSWMLMC